MIDIHNLFDALKVIIPITGILSAFIFVGFGFFDQHTDKFDKNVKKIITFWVSLLIVYSFMFSLEDKPILPESKISVYKAAYWNCKSSYKNKENEPLGFEELLCANIADKHIKILENNQKREVVND